ncbi:hypothetical protein HPTL_2031 [Hydrogenophilus thermoluteolus]|uniref:DUF2061 domain-containing protein n=1 Tax=Hydrogenophilus thermoluteolus TaxID=297 RepID=A0A2Z6E161_HYDTE|nr:hypothetical protein HPTL_2031 [Hydrogenophilus thermoluteolus]GLW60443.1 hypothetical protein Hthe01_07920 [Hydrogenophilus thermoluteolus]
MSRFRKIIAPHRQLAAKTLSYFTMHITVAALVAYAVTGSWQAALALSLIEPMVQSVAYFFHERFWAARARRTADAPSMRRQQTQPEREGDRGNHRSERDQPCHSGPVAAHP